MRSNGLRHLLTDSSSQSVNTVSTVERSDLPLGSGPFPLYFAGLDLEYVTEFKYPRFGAGIFYLFVNTLYGEILKTNNIYSNSNDTGGQMAAANITPPPIGSGTRVLSSSLPGCNLNATLYGKPFPATYHYAEETLLKMDKNNLIQRGLDQQPNIKVRCVSSIRSMMCIHFPLIVYFFRDPFIVCVYILNNLTTHTTNHIII